MFNKVKMHCGGLANSANTCYLNAALQCLGHCSAFQSLILSDAARDSELARLVGDLFREIYVHKRNAVPSALVRYVFDKFSSFLEPYQQNDVNDFLMAFIDKLNQQLSRPIDASPERLLRENSYSNSDFDVQRFKMDLSWLQKTAREHSPLVPMFHGQMISQIVCGGCGKIFHNYEIYCNLMLPISDASRTIDDCIDDYFKEDIVNGDAPLWTCDACGCKVPSKKTVKLWRNPEVLIISLKRFTHDLRKNEKRIEAPEEIDLSRHCLTRDSNRYRLRAVAHHTGSRGGGHYRACCLDSDGAWHDCDDLDVRRTSHPHHADGYVFFYSRS